MLCVNRYHTFKRFLGRWPTWRRVQREPCSELRVYHQQVLALLGFPSPPWTRCLKLHLFLPSARCLKSKRHKEKKM